MKNTVIASMSYKGYIRDLPSMVDEAFSLTLLTYAHQTDEFYGRIMSMDEYMKKYSNDPDLLASELTKGYTEYFSRHFEKVEGEVTAKKIAEDSYAYRLYIGFTFTHNGQGTELVKVMGYKDSKIMEVVHAFGG